MFNGCDSLTKAPELPAETLAEYCYSDMFSGCESLEELDLSNFKTTQVTDMSYMFQNMVLLF